MEYWVRLKDQDTIVRVEYWVRLKDKDTIEWSTGLD